MTNLLPTFDGRDVIASTIAVRKAGDGLSEALSIEPAPFHIGETVFVVLECEVTAVNHLPIPKAESVLARKHVLTTETATIVDGALVAEVLGQQKAKLETARLEAQRAKEEKDGVQRVPGTAPWDGEGEDPNAEGAVDDGDLPPDPFAEGDAEDEGAGTGPDGEAVDPPADPDDAEWEANPDA